MELALKLLLVMQLLLQLNCAAAQRNGLKLHHFLNQPFASKSIDISGQYELKFNKPIIVGGQEFDRIWLSSDIPAQLMIRSETHTVPIPSIPPSILLSSMENFATASKIFIKSLSPVNGMCIDKTKWQHYELLIKAAFSNFRFRALQAVAVMWQESSDATIGKLAEAVIMSSNTETYAVMNYANANAKKAAVKSFSSDLNLPDNASNSSNTNQPGRWVFSLHNRSIASPTFGAEAKQMLEPGNERIGFGADGIVGCSCGCHSNATCDAAASNIVHTGLPYGNHDCCHCAEPLIGNGVECLDRKLGFQFSSSAAAAAAAKSELLLVRANDISISINSANERHKRLLLLSVDAVAAVGLLLADRGEQSCRNLLGLSDSFKRQLSFQIRAKDNSKVMGKWRIIQRISSKPLLKTIATAVEEELVDDSLMAGSGKVVNAEKLSSMRLNYSSSSTIKRQKRFITLSSLNPHQVMLTASLMESKELILTFTDSWEFPLTCVGEYVAPFLSMQLDYSRSGTAAEASNIRGRLLKPMTCAEISCAEGQICRQSGISPRCECLEGFVEDNGKCRPGCGGRLCGANAECSSSNTCICRPGFYGNGVACSSDTGDCRLQINNCQSGYQCQLTAGISYRCHCVSSKCKRGVECERYKCSSQAAVCTQSQCSCPEGFTTQDNGRSCLPLRCTSASECSDLGNLAYCGADAKCAVCQPPKVVTDGRCEAKACVQRMCHRFAECGANGTSCVCKAGFNGDGYNHCRRNCSVITDCWPTELKAGSRKDLETSAVCNRTSSTCQCRQGFTEVIADDGRVSCSNCESNSDCAQGAKCKSAMELGAMRCSCSDGKFGNGKTQCHECDDARSCGDNAVCSTAHSTGNKCRCKFGYTGQPRDACTRQKTQLQLSQQSLLVYVNQEKVTVSCKVTQGPTLPEQLVWSSSQLLDDAVSGSSSGLRVSQSVVDATKMLSLSRVTKNDTEFYCFSNEEDASYRDMVKLQLEVRPDPCAKCHFRAFCNYSLPGCQCKFGFVGDGISKCVNATCLQQPLCDKSTERCLYSALNSTAGGYQCQCLPGFSRIGGKCQAPKSGCSIDSDCHANASCELEHSTRKCRCNPGFLGDGDTSCKPQPLSCRDLNRCAPDADCDFSSTDAQYRCVCRRGFLGDGESLCQRSANCSECDSNAECSEQSVPHRTLQGRVESRRLRVCKCKQNFISIGAECRSPSLVSTTLLAAKADLILRVSTSQLLGNSAATTRIAVSPARSSSASGKQAVALTFNCHSRQLVWTALGLDGLMRTGLRQRQQQEADIIPGDFGSVQGLAADWMSGNIFYTAVRQGVGEVGVVRQHEGRTYSRVLLRGPAGNVSRPRGVAVDPFLGKLYFTDWDRSNPKIESLFMNGAQRKVLHSPSNLLPNSIVRRFDSKLEEVCYIAVSNDNYMNHTSLQCLQQPADASQPIIKQELMQRDRGHPFDLTYSDGVFYWTDWTNSSSIQAFDAGAQAEAAVDLPFSDSARLMGVAAAVDNCPSKPAMSQASGQHPCSQTRNYGNCKYLCLAAPNLGAQCVCPDDMPDCEVAAV